MLLEFLVFLGVRFQIHRYFLEMAEWDGVTTREMILWVREGGERQALNVYQRSSLHANVQIAHEYSFIHNFNLKFFRVDRVSTI